MDHRAQLAHLSLTDLPSHYRLAVAAGVGAVITAEDERLSDADELVALALPPLVRLRAIALLADVCDAPCDLLATDMAHVAASTLRLVDRALAAHGRQHGYLTAAWLEDAWHCAHAEIACTRHECPCPTSCLVDQTAEALSSAILALPRDRLGVPEALADALGALLVIYLVGAVA